MITWYRPKNEQELTEHVLKGVPSLYLQSKTSTVISFSTLEIDCKNAGITPVDLSLLKPGLVWQNKENITVKGFVTWHDLKNFAQAQNRRVMTSPTDDVAAVLSGLATSCTGEHSFGYGTLRDQVQECKFINYQGKKVKLINENKIDHLFQDQVLLKDYQFKYKKYENFKNAPFPRLERETDLMIGSEGQLGVITEAVIKTAPLAPSDYYFILVPRWETDYNAHLEIYEKAQKFRGKILTLEFLDWNSLSYLPKSEWMQKTHCDVIFMEVLCQYSEQIFEELLNDLSNVGTDAIFSFDESKFQKLRKAVPRFINEMNSRKGITKKGTDIQVKSHDLHLLFNAYRDFSRQGINYNLFGHLGDAHLHFNFMPEPTQTEKCDVLLGELYKEIARWGASPFAEHGIGLIKQKYMLGFWDQSVRDMFSVLKSTWDPKGIFFPNGYLSSTIL